MNVFGVLEGIHCYQDSSWRGESKAVLCAELYMIINKESDKTLLHTHLQVLYWSKYLLCPLTLYHVVFLSLTYPRIRHGLYFQ